MYISEIWRYGIDVRQRLRSVRTCDAKLCVPEGRFNFQRWVAEAPKVLQQVLCVSCPSLRVVLTYASPC